MDEAMIFIWFLLEIKKANKRECHKFVHFIGWGPASSMELFLVVLMDFRSILMACQGKGISENVLVIQWFVNLCFVFFL